MGYECNEMEREIDKKATQMRTHKAAILLMAQKTAELLTILLN